jgi:hypothetical protein
LNYLTLKKPAGKESTSKDSKKGKNQPADRQKHMPKNQPKPVEKKPESNKPDKAASNLTEVLTFIFKF